MRRLRHDGFWVAAVVLAGSSQGTLAQPVPDSDNGRYTMSQTGDGFLRLDTRTGAMSACTNKSGWVCRVVPDERVALDAEIGRLQRENASLAAQLKAQGSGVSGKTSEKTSEALPKGDLEDRGTVPEKQASADGKSIPGGKDAGKETGKDTVIELRLPPQDQIIATIDRVWQHLVDIAGRMQKKIYEKI